MKSIISFLTLLFIKGISILFYKFNIGWPKDRAIQWNKVKIIIFLNHTSLFEPIFLGILPIPFLRMLSKRMVAPGASKTLDRPLVGLLYKLFSPGMTSISRKRDDTWVEFMESIQSDSIIVIAPEGRMKRQNGLDLNGKKMTVKPGVVEILAGLDKGEMVLAYSGGLHHVQIPGKGLPRVFKTIKMNVEVMDIPAYQQKFNALIGTEEWKKLVLEDLQHRLETNVPI